MSELINIDTVFLHIELITEGLEHPNPCAQNMQNGDPARRLGMKMRCRVGQDNETTETWVRLGGDRKVKKLDSLVDFLESKESKWSENQPRRYIKDRGGQRMYYTS